MTLDIGGNDVARCGFEGLKPECTKPALATLSSNLPKITSRLRAAAPDVQIVLLNYYDPFLVLDLVGSSGLGQKSVTELAKLNAAIDRSAKASGAQVADVAAAFQTTVKTPVEVKDVGTVPTNLARILQWTWMAAPRFDFHANDTGYAVMAGRWRSSCGERRVRPVSGGTARPDRWTKRPSRRRQGTMGPVLSRNGRFAGQVAHERVLTNG